MPAQCMQCSASIVDVDVRFTATPNWRERRARNGQNLTKSKKCTSDKKIASGNGRHCPLTASRTIVSFPDPTPTRGKGSGVLRAISWASRPCARMQNSHVILIIVMATHCLVCGSRMQQHSGLICAAGALSHEKSHAVNLIGAPEIRTATSPSPRNRSKYTRPSSPCRGGVWDRDYQNQRTL